MSVTSPSISESDVLNVSRGETLHLMAITTHPNYQSHSEPLQLDVVAIEELPLPVSGDRFRSFCNLGF